MSCRPLYPHQEACVQTMIHRERSGSVVLDAETSLQTPIFILGGQTGSGKTSAIFELIARQRCASDTVVCTQTQQVGSRAYLIKKHRRRRVCTTLIIVGKNVRQQWEDEATFFPSVRTRRVDIATVSTVRNVVETLDTIDALIVSETVLRALVSTLSVEYWRVVLDEADTTQIKIPMTVHAHRIWYVTATWRNLQRFTRESNRNLFLHKTLEHMPLHDIVVGETMCTAVPFAIQEHVHHFVDTPVSRVLRSVMTVAQMQRLECGDIQGVMMDLTGTYNVNKTLFDVLRDRLLIECHTARNRLQEATHAQSTVRMTQWSTRVAALNQKLENLVQRVDELTSEPCTICLSPLVHPLLTQCHHLFCTLCIVQWVEGQSGTCPVCRAHVNIAACNTFPTTIDQIPMVTNGDVETAVQQHCSPTQVLASLLQTLLSSGSRILVFALHDEHLQSVLPSDVQRLSGHVQTRQRQIAAFRHGLQRILLLNSLQACAGMHLPEATDVIFLHRPPRELEQQCVGRAYRPGRTTDLHVHYIIPQPQLC